MGVIQKIMILETVKVLVPLEDVKVKMRGSLYKTWSSHSLNYINTAHLFLIFSALGGLK